MDADGQHFATDIPLFAEYIDQNEDAMLIGSRNLKQENMPQKNTFANKFSNFWFTVQTAQSCQTPKQVSVSTRSARWATCT